MAEEPVGRRLALLVAVADYEDHRLPALPSVMDIEGVHGVLSDPDLGGFTCTRLVNPGSRDLAKAIRELLGGRSAADTVLFYFSGHGMKDRDGIFYLLASDTDKDILAGTALASTFLANEVDRSWAGAKILLLDSCFSGSFVPGVGRKSDNGVPGNQFGSGDGTVIIASSDSVSESFHVGGKSVFTSAVVEGIRTGAADRNGDGLVDTMDLLTHIRERTSAAGVDQRPRRWAFDLSSDLTVARSPRTGPSRPVSDATPYTSQEGQNSRPSRSESDDESSGSNRNLILVVLAALLAIGGLGAWLQLREADPIDDLTTGGEQTTTSTAVGSNDRDGDTVSAEVESGSTSTDVSSNIPEAEETDLASGGIEVKTRYSTKLSAATYVAASDDWVWASSAGRLYGFHRDDPQVWVDLTLGETEQQNSEVLAPGPDGGVWFGSDSETIRVLPPLDGSTTSINRFPEPARDMSATADGLVHSTQTAEGETSAIAWFDDQHEPTSETIPLAGTIWSIDAFEGGAWVAVTGGRLFVVDRATGEAEKVAQLLPNAKPHFIAFGDDTVWVADSAGVSVQAVDPASGTARVAFRFADVPEIARAVEGNADLADELSEDTAGCSVANVVYAQGLVWATWCGVRFVVAYDPIDGFAQAIATGNQPRDLAVAPDDSVWVAMADGTILELGRR